MPLVSHTKYAEIGSLQKPNADSACPQLNELGRKNLKSGNEGGKVGQIKFQRKCKKM